MYLYIIRHGETYGNLNGDGFTETDLTDNGLNQAFLLGERFKDERIAIFMNKVACKDAKIVFFENEENRQIFIKNFL